MGFFGRLYAALFVPAEAVAEMFKEEEPKPFRLPPGLEPLPIEQVRAYARLVTRAREGSRLIFTAEGTQELPAEEYEQMLIDTWKNMGSDTVFMMMDSMIAGAKKK